MTIYLDYNAKAPLRPEVREAMAIAMDLDGNPSSVHGPGRKARMHIDTARRQVADFINCEAEEIILTSGATEANVTALSGTKAQRRMIAADAHPSLISELAPDKDVLLPIHTNGLINLDALEALLKLYGSNAIVAILWVNNETGVIQPVSDIARLTKTYGAWLHIDAVQALGRVEINFRELGAQSLSLSAHKIGGPLGCGALILHAHNDILPLIRGGGQERRRRGGTENTIAIIGFGEACTCAKRDFAKFQDLKILRDRLEENVIAACPKAVIIGRQTPRVGNTTLISLPGISAETQLMKLDLSGIAVSSGAACSSGSVRSSHVLDAMGHPQRIATSAIRVSLGWNTTTEDIACFERAYLRMYHSFTMETP